MFPLPVRQQGVMTINDDGASVVGQEDLDIIMIGFDCRWLRLRFAF